MKPYKLRIDHGKTKKGRVCITENKTPWFSWAVAAGSNETVSASRIKVQKEQEVLWDSGWVSGTEQGMRYAGKPLETGEVYELQIQLQGADGTESEAAKQAFCPGKIENWNAPWIAEKESPPNTVPHFVKDFSVEKEIASACLFVCGIGYHKVYLNGQGVLTDPLNPAYSEYEKRCYYSVIPEMESVLKKGANRMGIQVAAGWRAPENVCYRHTNRIPAYAGKTQLSAMLRIRYADGSVEWMTTDESWKYGYGAIRTSNLFDGEIYDANVGPKNFSSPSEELPDWKNAVKLEAPGGKMWPQILENIREQEIYHPFSVNEVAEGIYGIDFGQNLAGVCRIRLPRHLKKGQVIHLRHMEVLDEEGRLFLEPLRYAAAEDLYIAAGDGQDPEYWQPEFTYHGFRYAEVEGYGDVLEKTDIAAVSLYTDISSESHFSCGNPLADQIYQNAVQTEKANLHSVMTDCPQRDERMGWMNDATVRFEAAPYVFDVGHLFEKIVRDLMDVQGEDGSITCTAPYAFGERPADPVCSSYLIAGWQNWLHTGNVEILREAYPGFEAWNRLLESRSEDYIVTYTYYGDWAGPSYACQGEEDPRSAATPGIFMSTGYFYYNTGLLAKMAEVLGYEEKKQACLRKAEKIRKAFLKKWWNPETGVVGTGSQGCQSFALWLDILPEEGRDLAARVLHEDLAAKEYRFTTGNLCTRYLMDVLTRYGYLEDAWKLLTREEYPSFGFMIQNEATTIWERFELKKNPSMNSHNHPMYGAVYYWLYAYLAGIKPLDAGWKRFSVKPYLPEKLLSASAVVETPYGDVQVRWIRRYGGTHLYVTVPYGTEAEVSLPWGETEIVKTGFYHWKKLDD